MSDFNSAIKKPWQVWACFWIMLFFAAMHLFIAMAENVEIYYFSFILEVLTAIGILKMWRWVYYIVIGLSILNVILLVFAVFGNPYAILSLIISAGYVMLLIKTLPFINVRRVV